MTNYTDNIGKATKDHISLETAKLLKDCGVESEYLYWETDDSVRWQSKDLLKKQWVIARRTDLQRFKVANTLPAFTWGEILWEHADKFFGDKNHYHVTINNLEQLGYDYVATHILIDLMHKRYDKADEYFRQTCILIPQPTNE